MKLRIIAAVLGLFLLTVQASAQEKTVLKDQKDKMSYIIGMDIGKNLKMQSIEINSEAFLKGVNDAFSGGQPLLTDQEIRDTMAVFQKEMMAKQDEKARKNKQEGEAFLSENKKKEGVKTLPSGLEYKVIKEGTGKKPQLTDTVIVNYRGTLIDGTEFDSSYRRGQPATLQVNGVIPGWTEALQLMKEGDKWQLYVPSNLAYGERGAGGVIGPNAALVFEVELLSVQEKK
jgi:FKBP-type peptidyl-prolyl cis-trans isomerase FklB